MKAYLLIFFFSLLSLLFPDDCLGENSKDFAQVRVVSDGDLAQDSNLVLLLYNDHVLPEALEKVASPQKYIGCLKDGQYIFNLKMDALPVYFTLFKNPADKPILKDYLVAPGDDFTIFLSAGKMSFSGKGASRNACKFALENNFKKLQDSLLRPFNATDSIRHSIDSFNYYRQNLKGYFILLSEICDIQVRFLQRYREVVDSTSYSILMADVVGKYQKPAISTSQFYFINGNLERSQRNFDAVQSYIHSYQHYISDIPENKLALSREYIQYAYLRTSLEGTLHNFRDNYWDMVRSRYSGLFKEKLLISRIFYGLKYESRLDSLIERFIMDHDIESTYFKDKLTSLAGTIKAGSAAYDFSLPDNHGRNVKLSNFRGKLVLLDFWYTGCAPCLFYYQQALSVVEKRYRNHPGIVFLSICADKEKDKWLKSIDEGKYAEIDGTNLYTEGQGWGHRVLKEYYVDSFPMAVLIGKDGNLITNNIYELGGGRNVNPQRLIDTINNYITGNTH